MRARKPGGRPARIVLKGRAWALAAVLALQALCAIFFISDALEELSVATLDVHDAFEGFVGLALIVGVIFGVREMRRVMERAGRAEAAVTVASGALGAVIEEHFTRWQLTGAERDVALLAIKGFEIAEIADLRKTASGTVRAQLTKVYAKAGVAGRPQLVSLFIDDLLGGALAGMEPVEKEVPALS